jgi:hypothetical protein
MRKTGGSQAEAEGCSGASGSEKGREEEEKSGKERESDSLGWCVQKCKSVRSVRSLSQCCKIETDLNRAERKCLKCLQTFKYIRLPGPPPPVYQYALFAIFQ